MDRTSKIKVDFTKNGQKYSAIFGVTREPSGTTYHMHAEVFAEDGKKFFEKERGGLDYSQVEHALTFVFHQAFVEN